MPRPTALLFDLDGTLVDSRADLAAAVNAGRRALGRAPLAVDVVTPMIGNGVAVLMERALPGASPAELEAGILEFRAFYDVHCCDATPAYPGIAEALGALQGLPLVVVSNKPAGLSETVLEGAGLRHFFLAVVGGDSTAAKKPDPAPVRRGLELAGARPGRGAVLVGDGPTDIAGGRAAGIATCAVGWGFTPLAALRAEGPDHEALAPEDLPRLFRPR
ncbi:MAG: HAD-IA family hydrolase [Planctomycetales bacterium]|nr:HAD-IA family hydrolase [Planctomycetales bacterium]